MTPKGGIGLEFGPRGLVYGGLENTRFTTTPKPSTVTGSFKGDRKLIHPNSVKNSDNRRVIFDSSLTSGQTGLVSPSTRLFQPHSLSKDKERAIVNELSKESPLLTDIYLPPPVPTIMPPPAPRATGMRKGFKPGLVLDIDDINKQHSAGGEGGFMLPK